MFGVFASFLQLAATVNAFLRCLQNKFVLGAVGALVRVALLLAGAASLFVVKAQQAGGTSASGGITLLALVATVGGPLVSFVVLAIAYRRMRGLSAAQEEEASRPFRAWLPVALFDAAFVAINFFAWFMTRDM